jgi:glutathione S-transferase
MSIQPCLGRRSNVGQLPPTPLTKPEQAMSYTLAAFERSPDRGRGRESDMRVRCALEEVGQPYGVRLPSFDVLKQPAHRARSPFGQIPTLEDGDVVLFESGAIVLHIAQRHPGLLPVDEGARERALAWMFAAIGTLDPPIMERAMCALLERDQPWYAQRLPVLDRQVDTRLGQLSRWLGDADWLEGAFSAGDLMTVHVLLRLRGSGLLDDHPYLLG